MRFLYRVRFRRDHGWAPDHMSQYVDGDLAPSGRERIDGHVRNCPECERLLAGLSALVDRLSHVGQPVGGVDAVRLAAAVRGRLDEPPAS